MMKHEPQGDERSLEQDSYILHKSIYIIICAGYQEQYNFICISPILPCPKMACSEVDQVVPFHMAICQENKCLKINQIIVAIFFIHGKMRRKKIAKIKSKIYKEKE